MTTEQEAIALLRRDLLRYGALVPYDVKELAEWAQNTAKHINDLLLSRASVESEPKAAGQHGHVSSQGHVSAAQEYGPCSCEDGGKCLYVNGGPACMNEGPAAPNEAPTPRTDAVSVVGRLWRNGWYGPESEWVPSLDARQLERELAASISVDHAAVDAMNDLLKKRETELAKAEMQNFDHETAIAKLQSELAAARRAKEGK